MLFSICAFYFFFLLHSPFDEYRRTAEILLFTQCITERESKYLFCKNGGFVENEYCIDEYGNFVPGELKRNLKIKGF